MEKLTETLQIKCTQKEKKAFEKLAEKSKFKTASKLGRELLKLEEL